MADEQEIYEVRRTRFKEWMALKGLSGADVGRRLDRTRGYISLVLTKRKAFGERFARDAEKILGMPDGYLDCKPEPTLKSVVAWNSPDDLSPGTYALVPRVGVSVSAGSGTIVSEEQELPPLAFREDWLRKRGVTSRGSLRVCSVSGDSMEPFLFDGDSVLIDLSQTVVMNNEIYAIRYSDELRIKRLGKRFDGGLMIRSDNPRYPEESLTPEQAAHITVIGRMLWRGG